LENFTPVSALLGGALIGFSAFLLLWFNGRIAGISSIMNRMFSSSGPDRYWRISFLLGLLIGAAVWQGIGTQPFAPRQGYPLPLIIVGGFLVGLGTRLGSGCTSGYGICGLSLMSYRSIVATLTFMASGFVTVFIIRHLV